MKWQMVVKRGGIVVQETSGTEQDPFWNLARSSEDSGTSATVESKVSHWGNHVSVSFSVSIQCPQTKQNIEYAAYLAYQTATRFVNDAVSRMDQSMPMLPTV